jgi:hypothetical protein
MVTTVWRQDRIFKSEEDKGIGSKLFGYVAEEWNWAVALLGLNIGIDARGGWRG